MTSIKYKYITYTERETEQKERYRHGRVYIDGNLNKDRRRQVIEIENEQNPDKEIENRIEFYNYRMLGLWTS